MTDVVQTGNEGGLKIAVAASMSDRRDASCRVLSVTGFNIRGEKEKGRTKFNFRNLVTNFTRPYSRSV